VKARRAINAQSAEALCLSHADQIASACFKHTQTPNCAEACAARPVTFAQSGAMQYQELREDGFRSGGGMVEGCVNASRAFRWRGMRWCRPGWSDASDSRRDHEPSL